MSKQDPTHLITPIYPLHQLTTPPFEEEAKRAVLKHGCSLEESEDRCVIFFPEGTTKTEILPRVRNERYWITLPDGYVLYESYDAYGEISYLKYLSEEGDGGVRGEFPADERTIEKASGWLSASVGSQ